MIIRLVPHEIEEKCKAVQASGQSIGMQMHGNGDRLPRCGGEN